MTKRWPGFLLITMLLVAWEFCSAVKLIDPVSFPRVSLIFVSWFKGLAGGGLLVQLLPSLGRIFAGFAPGGDGGGAARSVDGQHILRLSAARADHRVHPADPRAAYIPVAILFLGIGNEMKIFIVFLACLFPVLLNTYGGVRGVDPVLVDTGRTFGLSRLSALRQIIFPAVLPNILTGMRISLGIALIVAIVAEMITGNSGIGYYILDMQRTFRVPEMFAGIFTLGVLGFLINFGFLKLEHHLLRWRGTTDDI